MNITSVSNTQLYSIVTGRQMAWVNCDITKVGGYSKEELLEMSAKNINSSSIDTLVKSGVSFMDNMSISDNDLGDFIGKMGRRIDDAYRNGTLSEEDHKTLCAELDKYIDDAVYQVEYKRCAREINKPDGYGAAGIYSGLQIGETRNRVLEMMKEARDEPQPWQVNRQALMDRINMVRNAIIPQVPKSAKVEDASATIYSILNGENTAPENPKTEMRPLLKTGCGENDYDFGYIKLLQDYIDNGTDFSNLKTISEMFMEENSEVNTRIRLASASADPIDKDFIIDHISKLAKNLDKAYKDGILDSREHKELNKQLNDYMTQLTNAFRRAEASRECMLAESRRDPLSKALYFAVKDFEQIQADRENFVRSYLENHPYDMREIIEAVNAKRQEG
ncbi:MAG: hypothetical protein ACI4SF_14020 [Oscillospiraceae bacterium]